MTVREKIANDLVNHGLWPEEASEVMDIVDQAKESESMQGRWNDSSDGYPEVLFKTLFMIAKRHAIIYLEANKPDHFALMFLKA